MKIIVACGTIIGSCTVVGIACYIIFKRRRKLIDSGDAFKNIIISTVSTEEACDKTVCELIRRCSKHRALGFDCEWVTSKSSRNPVALLQLSSYDGYCALFRLNHLKTVPKSLMNLLEDDYIYKVGVASTDDAKFLYQDYGVLLKCTIDVRHIVELSGHETGGLAMLAKTLLGVILDKNWKLRCSNWEAEVLTSSQIMYAAIDAHVAIVIFVKLIEEMGSNSFLSFFVKSNCNIWERLDEICAKYSDMKYKSKTKNINKQKRSPIKNDSKLSQQDLNLNKRYSNATRTKPLYDNCFLQAPDGEPLCTCDNKKALWYIDKQLADKVCEEPLTVRLRFEPAGRSVGAAGRYYQLPKENKCVVCGATNSYIRKNVVPREYRKYFPDVMKDHSSHDVVLLCARCHQRSNALDQAVREELAGECAAPLPSAGRAKYAEDATCKKIRSAARALLYQTRRHALPEARREQLETELLQHYPAHQLVTQELLQEAADIQVAVENPEFEYHGHKVVEQYQRAGGLLRLEERWRRHFLSAMRPAHLPPLWSATHNEERLRVRFDEGRLSKQDFELIGLNTDYFTEKKEV